MIGEFAESWWLFRDAYLSGWAIAIGLSWMGLWVVARNEIFLGVAVSQASTLGIALALAIGVGQEDQPGEGRALSTVLAVVAACITALLSARGGGQGKESREAITGWVFLVAASAPAILLASSPHGLEEIHRLVFSTLLGAMPWDPWILGTVALATGVVAFQFRDRLLLAALDPEMARAVGIRLRRVETLAALWLGLFVGLSMRVSGLLFTFGCLVLPALASRRIARSATPLLWLSPALALGAVVPGFVVANGLDLPPAHTSVAIMAAVVAAAWAAPLFKRRN